MVNSKVLMNLNSNSSGIVIILGLFSKEMEKQLNQQIGKSKTCLCTSKQRSSTLPSDMNANTLDAIRARAQDNDVCRK